MDDYDVLIVGSGACGGIAAQQLTAAGLRVLILEAGPDASSSTDSGAMKNEYVKPLPPGATEDDLEGMSEATRLINTPGNWRNDIYTILSIVLGWPRPQPTGSIAIANALATNPRYPIQSMVGLFGPSTQNLFVDEIDNPYMAPASAPFYWVRNRVLGGRTQTWQRKSPRLEDDVFDAAERDGFGQPWPIRAADLQPYYEVAERAMRVLGAVEAGAPSYQGALPPKSLAPIEEEFIKAVHSRWPNRRIHVMPFASPHDSDKDPHKPAPPIDGGKNPTHDCSVRCTIANARATGKLTILTSAIVSRVLMDWQRGHATGVSYIDAESGELREAQAKVVVLCASTLESTRILLNSRSESAPDGLANSSGTLGHYLTDHLMGMGALGVKSSKSKPASMPTLWLPPFQNTRGDNKKHGFIRGYQLNCSFCGMWSGVFRRYRQAISIMADGEVLPKFENKVSIDESVKDKWGIPVLRIEYRRGENEAAMARDMMASMEEIIEAAGYKVAYRATDPLPPGLSVHELGTARMGDDPKNSVVNPYCRTWDVPNLYVTDGAVFPSSGSQNPTLTMMALTARACDHIIEQLSSGSD